MRNILTRYLWLMRTIKENQGITFEELSTKWADSPYSEGEPLPRRTFFDWRNNVEELFGLDIVSRREGKHNGYYLKTMDNDRLSNIDEWLLNSISLSVQVSDARKLHDRVLPEHIPSGEQFLLPMIDAMKKNRTVKVLYQKFVDEEPRERIIEPYCVKVFEKRWYVTGRDTEKKELRTFALDRIQNLTITQRTFILPKSFTAKQHFRYSYGIYGGPELKPEEIVIRAFGTMSKYLRTLPIHSSQKEIKHTADYSDFRFKMAVSYDFRQYLLAQGAQIEVLKPERLRLDLTAQITQMAALYRP